MLSAYGTGSSSAFFGCWSEQMRMSITWATMGGNRWFHRIQGDMISWTQWIFLTNCSYRKTFHQDRTFFFGMSKGKDNRGMRIPRWKCQRKEVWLLPALPELLPWVFDICPFCSHCYVREALDKVCSVDTLWEAVLTLGPNYVLEPHWWLCYTPGYVQAIQWVPVANVRICCSCQRWWLHEPLHVKKFHRPHSRENRVSQGPSPARPSGGTDSVARRFHEMGCCTGAIHPEYVAVCVRLCEHLGCEPLLSQHGINKPRHYTRLCWLCPETRLAVPRDEAGCAKKASE